MLRVHRVLFSKFKINIVPDKRNDLRRNQIGISETSLYLISRVFHVIILVNVHSLKAREGVDSKI